MKIMGRYCVRVKVSVAVTAGALFMSMIASPAVAQNVSWLSIVGIHQAGNVVGNITGGGQPWTTLFGHAQVDLSGGTVQFQVVGLVLAGGNTIGTPGAVNQVKGTLLCDAGNTNVTIDTPLVPLSPQGNANFFGTVGAIPTTCNPSNVVFLVRIAANRWIANGAIRFSLP